MDIEHVARFEAIEAEQKALLKRLAALEAKAGRQEIEAEVDADTTVGPHNFVTSGRRIG